MRRCFGVQDGMSSTRCPSNADKSPAIRMTLFASPTRNATAIAATGESRSAGGLAYYGTEHHTSALDALPSIPIVRLLLSKLFSLFSKCLWAIEDKIVNYTKTTPNTR